jgi:hypothetical protein
MVFGILLAVIGGSIVGSEVLDEPIRSNEVSLPDEVKKEISAIYTQLSTYKEPQHKPLRKLLSMLEYPGFIIFSDERLFIICETVDNLLSNTYNTWKYNDIKKYLLRLKQVLTDPNTTVLYGDEEEVKSLKNIYEDYARKMGKPLPRSESESATCIIF